MLSGIDPTSEQFLNAVSKIQARISRAEQQMSSGLRVTTASDAPASIADILQLTTDLSRNAQVSTNLGRVQPEVDTAESTLSSSISVLDSAMSIASQATGPLQNASTRTQLAGQVEALMEQMVAASNTVVDGRYIFSGDDDSQPSYALDLTMPTGVERLLTSQTVTKQIEDAAGTRFVVGRTAQEIFDPRDPADDDTPASGNVFAALASLRTALLANDSDGIVKSVPALQAASQHLNLEAGFYGATQNRIATASTQANSLKLSLTSELSDQRDTDYSAAIMDLTQGQTQLQATLAAQAQRPRKSLFDFLG